MDGGWGGWGRDRLWKGLLNWKGVLGVTINQWRALDENQYSARGWGWGNKLIEESYMFPLDGGSNRLRQ